MGIQRNSTFKNVYSRWCISIYISIYIYLYITQTPHMLNMENSITQVLLGSSFSKWDLKVDISVSWQGFFICMFEICVGGLPCGLARPLMTQYFNLLEAMLDMGSKTRTSVSRTEHS